MFHIKNVKLLAWLAFGMMFAQCHKNQYLFQQTNGLATNEKSAIWQQGNPTIQSGDKISVSVWGHPELSIGDVTGNFSANDVTGRWLLVNDQGEVKLPKIGFVKIEGFNIKEAGIYLENRFSEQIKDPIVIVRVLNHHFTILGEVRKPGVYDLNNEPISVVQGLGLAAGLTEDAEPKLVELIRNGAHGPEKMRLNLTDFATLEQHNLTLQPGDILYAPPTHRKSARKNLDRAVPVVSMVASLAALISLIKF
jgi:polysaccharide biosynthesis/export protein